MQTILELCQISKRYDDHIILDEISFAVKSGTTIAITGESGGGKTTLLSIMGLLQAADSGEILLEGKRLSKQDTFQLAKLRSQYFGYVFQRARLVNSLSALDNVMLPAWIAGMGPSMETKAAGLLSSFGLGNRLHHKPHELSLGQLRRVSLARAILLNPRILLADEPTNDLDPKLAMLITDELLAMKNQDAAVIIVTHDPGIAARADYSFQLVKGNLIHTRVPTSMISAAGDTTDQQVGSLLVHNDTNCNI